jgi:hypothetical protein
MQLSGVVYLMLLVGLGTVSPQRSFKTPRNPGNTVIEGELHVLCVTTSSYMKQTFVMLAFMSKSASFAV